MAAGAGRDFKMKKATVAVAGLRTTGMTGNAQPIDITDTESGGIREFLADAFGSETLEISADGVTKGTILRAAWFGNAAAKHLSDITLEWPNGDTYAANFILTSYTETGQFEGATEFSCTLQRNGAGTYTAA